MLKTTIEMISLVFLVIGALNWGLIGVLNFNFIGWLFSGSLGFIAVIVYILVGVSALIHVLSRDYYLPFLGKSVYPCGSLLEKVPKDANMELVIKVQPLVNVIYWGAEPSRKIIDNPWSAYSEFENTGVAKADENGVVRLRFRKPAEYKVRGMFGDKKLDAHIHYRTCSLSGMLSRVETVFI